MPVPKGTPLAIAGSSKAASPAETTRQGEKDLEATLGAVEHIHALRLQIIHDVGSVREVEQAAVHTLMAEFARLPCYPVQRPHQEFISSTLRAGDLQ